jgi:glutamate/tyrosine decarboxylase-like PLP-dependent enzyme
MPERSPDSVQRFLDGVYPYRREFETFRRLPPEGRDRADVLGVLEAMAAREDAKGDAGHVSGSLYHGDHEHYHFLTEAYGYFAHANVLQRDMYPSATKLEGEIVAMTAGMLHGEAAPDVCGVLTSGGTESLLTQVYTYREWGAARGIERPNIVAPHTIHCAVDKACHYFGVELRKGTLGDDWRADVDWIAAHVDENTVAVNASAGNYPHGLVDPIAELGALALERGTNLHVDGCLGGFILPWGEELGYPVPRFDFRVPGVTSISCDTHKFGYALKGTSVLLYATKELRRHQYFTAAEWPGGTYLSPGMAGSRSGGLIAATWAAMVTLGERGYREIARAIFDTAAQLRSGIESIPGYRIIGEPTFLVAFTSDEFDIFHANDHLQAKGWRMNGLQAPRALHFCVTKPNTQPGVVERFLADLAEAADYARRPAREQPKSGALYGLSGAGPEGVRAVHELLAGAIDAFYEPAPAS